MKNNTERKKICLSRCMTSMTKKWFWNLCSKPCPCFFIIVKHGKNMEKHGETTPCTLTSVRMTRSLTCFNWWQGVLYQKYMCSLAPWWYIQCQVSVTFVWHMETFATYITPIFCHFSSFLTECTKWPFVFGLEPSWCLGTF